MCFRLVLENIVVAGQKLFLLCLGQNQSGYTIYEGKTDNVRKDHFPVMSIL